jgi:hypothetical protein
MNETCSIEQLGRYQYRVNDRIVNYSSIIILPKETQIPPWIGLLFGMMQMGFLELLPGFLESIRVKIKIQIASILSTIHNRQTIISRSLLCFNFASLLKKGCLRSSGAIRVFLSEDARFSYLEQTMLRSLRVPGLFPTHQRILVDQGFQYHPLDRQ